MNEDARMPPGFAERWMGKRVRTFRGPSSRLEGVIVDLRASGQFAEARVEYPSRLGGEPFSAWIPLRRLLVLDD